jgi:uncharacterized membrane protein (DUF4010 family)
MPGITSPLPPPELRVSKLTKAKPADGDSGMTTEIATLLIYVIGVLVGIGLCGYVAYKLFGARAGTILGGVIGGLISSTATTVSYARRTKEDQRLAPLGALVIMIASCISLVRVILAIGAVAPGSFAALAPPLGAMVLACGVITGGLHFFSHAGQVSMPEQGNPTEFKPALVFGLLYALVLLGVAFAKDRFGNSGLYAVALVSGLTDMDAITLSTARLAAAFTVETGTAWRAILIAAMANFVFKFAIVATLGVRALAGRVALAFGFALTAAGMILWLWPG